MQRKNELNNKKLRTEWIVSPENFSFIVVSHNSCYGFSKLLFFCEWVVLLHLLCNNGLKLFSCLIMVVHVLKSMKMNSMLFDTLFVRTQNHLNDTYSESSTFNLVDIGTCLYIS